VTRADGIFVAVVQPGNTVDFRKIQVGRDYGTEIEALSGLSEGEQVVVNPSDNVKPGITVKVALRK
jgi:hypothetical protein